MRAATDSISRSLGVAVGIAVSTTLSASVLL